MLKQETDIIWPRKASFWKRLIAFGIDNILVAFLIISVCSIFNTLDVIQEMLLEISPFVYGTISEHYRQTTIGKSIMKLRVLDRDGQRPTLLTSFYRNFGKIASGYNATQGFFRILTPHIMLTTHDEYAGCLVIDDRKQNIGKSATD